MPRISPGHDDPAYGVSGSPQEPTLARLIEARILMQDGRNHGAHHEILSHTVTHGRAIPFAISGPALSERGLVVLRLVYRSQHSPPGILHIIECSQGNHFELVFYAHGRQFLGALKRKKIWQGIEKSIIRRAGDFAFSCFLDTRGLLLVSLRLFLFFFRLV